MQLTNYILACRNWRKLRRTLISTARLPTTYRDLSQRKRVRFSTVTTGTFA